MWQFPARVQMSSSVGNRYFKSYEEGTPDLEIREEISNTHQIKRKP